MIHVRRCEHDADPRGVAAWAHRHGTPCLYCWYEEGLPLPPRVVVVPPPPKPNHCATCGAPCSARALRCIRHSGRTHSQALMLREYREALS